MAAELIILPCDAPVPEDAVRGRKRLKVYEALEAMAVGGSPIEINRSLAATQHYVYRYRVENGRDMAFKVRVSKPGWCRIWRVR